jgi:hypothetical protein
MISHEFALFALLLGFVVGALTMRFTAYRPTYPVVVAAIVRSLGGSVTVPYKHLVAAEKGELSVRETFDGSRVFTVRADTKQGDK